LERVCAESDNSETTSGNSVESAIEICMSAGFDVSIKQTTNTPPATATTTTTTTTTSAPAAEGTTQKPTSGNTEVDKLCEDFAKARQCTKENVTTGANGLSTSTQVNCDDGAVSYYSKQIVTKSGGSITASEEDLPAFCTAGNNSSGIKSFMDSLNQGIQQGASAGAVGF
jgi:predicted phage tail protein